MNRLLGPVFWCELVTGSRRLRHFWVRALYGAALLALLTVQSYDYDWGGPGSSARQANLAAGFFERFALLQMAVVLLATPAMVATTISQERERRTIEYLFASQLSNCEIVLGKLGARLAQIVLLLLTGLPVLAFAMTMGGISPDSLLLAFFATLSTLCMTAGAATLVSVLTSRARHALARTLGLVLAATMAPILLKWVDISPALARGPFEFVATALEWAFDLNPFVVVSRLLAGDANGNSGMQTFGPVLAWQASIGLAAIVLSVVCVRRVHSRGEGRGRKRRRAGNNDRRLLRWLLERAPMLAKELCMRRGGWLGRAFALLAILGAVAGEAFFVYEYQTGPRRVWQTQTHELVTKSSLLGAAMALAAVIAVSIRGATSVTHEKDRDCWTTLVSTTLTGPEIVAAKFWASLGAGRACYLAAAVAWITPLLFERTFFVDCLATFLVVAVQIAFAGALGVAISTCARTSTRAVGWAIGILVVVGGGYLAALAPFLRLGGPGRPVYEYFSLCLPYLNISPFGMWVTAQAGHGRDEFPSLLRSYLIGLSVYAVAAVALQVWTRRNFDRLAGRAGSTAPKPGP